MKLVSLWGCATFGFCAIAHFPCAKSAPRIASGKEAECPEDCPEPIDPGKSGSYQSMSVNGSGC